MGIPYQELEQAGVDIAGAVKEDFLNKFSEGHHRHNSSIYTGKTSIDNFGDRVEVVYKLANPITFDFSPIPSNRFRPVWTSHLLTKGMSANQKENVLSVPPNLGVDGKNVEFEILVYEGTTDTEKLRVPFKWDLTARCAVILNEENGVYTINLEPIKVEFSKGSAFVQKAIHEALVDKSGKSNVSAYSAGDETWCVKIEELILLLLNNVISSQISNFIRSFELPKAIDLADGISFFPNYLDVTNDYLIVGGQVDESAILNSSLQTDARAVLNEYSRRVDEELSQLSDSELMSWDSSKSSSISWLRSKRMELEEEVQRLSISPSSGFSKNISLLFNGKPFDLIAKRELSIRDGWKKEKKLDRALKAEVGWWLRLENPSGRVIQNGIQIEVTPSIGGTLRICHFDFDPKRFGKWKCYGPCLTLTIKNFRVSAYPTFPTDGVYFRGRFDSDGMAIDICDFPSWANDILSWILSSLTDPIIDYLGVILSLFRIKVMGYPHHFPGTGLEWTPNINTKPDNVGPYLEFSADPSFK